MIRRRLLKLEREAKVKEIAFRADFWMINRYKE